jgi:hypothetical protein
MKVFCTLQRSSYSIDYETKFFQFHVFASKSKAKQMKTRYQFLILLTPGNGPSFDGEFIPYFAQTRAKTALKKSYMASLEGARSTGQMTWHSKTKASLLHSRKAQFIFCHFFHAF